MALIAWREVTQLELRRSSFLLFLQNKIRSGHSSIMGLTVSGYLSQCGKINSAPFKLAGLCRSQRRPFNTQGVILIKLAGVFSVMHVTYSGDRRAQIRPIWVL